MKTERKVRLYQKLLPVIAHVPRNRQYSVGEGGGLDELEGENVSEENENTPAADGDTPQAHKENLTRGNTANTPQYDLATLHEIALH